MLLKRTFSALPNLIQKGSNRFAFQKFDYEDGLNFRSLLND
jgi:hypothetical protein